MKWKSTRRANSSHGTIDHNLPRRSKRPKRTGSSLRPSPGQYSKGRTSPLPRFAFKTYPEKGFWPGKGESCLNVAFHWNKHVSSAVRLELNTIPRAAQQYASPPPPASLPGVHARVNEQFVPQLPFCRDGPGSQLYVLLLGANPSFPPPYLEEEKNLAALVLES